MHNGSGSKYRRKELQAWHKVKDLDVGCPSDEVGKILGLLVEDYLASNNLVLYVFSEVLEHGLVCFGRLSLEIEVFVL